MNLKRVTITGADDSTSIPELVNLSKEFPFVEWGILVSKRHEGEFRFPSRHWIERFSDVAGRAKLNVSTHVCGVWVRQMFVGELNWADLPVCINIAQRVQINTHAERHVSTTGLISSLLESPNDPEFIFQWDGVNDHLTHAVHARSIAVSALFDTSGGAGVLPSEWPQSDQPFWCGYAGGLGPANVVEQIEKIEARSPRPYWIDMERRVRVDDDSSLNMMAVRSVLEQCAPLIA